LSGVHSKHAQTLALGALFQSTTTETASEEPVEATEGAPQTTTESVTSGVSQEQLTEALKKYFYAKVGVIYETPTTPLDPTVEQPEADSTLLATA
jgi:hypothetical protein